MNILFAIPVNKAQAKPILATLKRIKESKLYDFGSDRAVMIVANNYAQSEITKDIGLLIQEMFMGYDNYTTHDYDDGSEISALNHIMRHTTQYCHDVRSDVDGFFLFQPDITPIKKDWWEILKGEFARSGKLCLYAKMDILNEKKQSIGTVFNPCAMYHKNCPEKINGLYGGPSVAFYDMASWSMIENGHRSDFMTDVTFDPDVEIDSQKVLIVGDKKDKYAKMIKDGKDFIVVRNYDIEALTINVKQAVAYLNYRFERGDAEEIKKEVNDSGFLSKLCGEDKIPVEEGKSEVQQEIQTKKSNPKK